MSRFLQLRELQSSQNDAIREYWRDVQGTAGVIRQGFSDYMELPSEIYTDSSSREERQYVKLAKFEGGEFKDARLHELSGEDSWLDFSLGLTIDKELNTYPKKTLFTKLRLKKEDGGYHVTSPDHPFSIKASGTDGQADFSELYENIFQILRKHLSYKP